MRSREIRNRRRRLFLAIILAVCVTSGLICAAAITAATGTASAKVVDGEKIYRVDQGETNQMLAQARKQGLKPVEPGDEVELSADSSILTVRRKIDFYVLEGGVREKFPAHSGETIEEALKDNGLELKEGDQVTPSRDLVISASLTVEVKRLCRVNVTAGGEVRELELLGGTVADALKEAGVKLGEQDSCNFDLESPLEDGMSIEISQAFHIRVTADGKTRDYQVAAATVASALEKCGITVGKEDRLNVPWDAELKDRMRIVLQRVKIEEEREKEEIDYETKYISTRDLPQGETKRLTAGLKGSKESSYRAVYVDGKLESRELLSEKVTAEPIKEVVMRGIGYTTTAPQLDFEDDGSGYQGSDSSGSGSSDGSGGGVLSQPALTVNAEGGTFTDAWGETVTYTKAMTGTCTAYCIPGGTTSVGLEAVRGVIAVDPKIIPYGTRMYVASPDGKIVYGYGVAGDTGGACLDGDIIADLCYDTLEECSIIGRREMVLFILP